MTGRRQRRGLTALLLTGAVVALAGCTGPSPNPQPDPTSAPASAEPSSPPPPTDADTGAAATRALVRYLTDNGYTDIKAGTNSVRYTFEPDTFQVTITCQRGLRHEVGWTGLCGGTAKGIDPYVIPARVVAGPRAEAYAMSTDDAAYCGSDDAPAWVQRELERASEEYCYLEQEDG